MALSYDQITATTRKHFIPKLVDNIFVSNVITQRLLKKSVSTSGGEKIVEPLIYAKGRSGFYDSYDVLDISPTDEITAAAYDWKFAYAAITISRKEELQNSGPDAVIDLLKSKMKIAEMTIKDTFGTNVFTTGATSANAFVGFYDLIEQNSSAVGGIDPSSYSWWSSNTLNVTSASNYGNSTAPDWDAIVTTTNASYVHKFMRDMYGQCTEDNIQPSLIVTTQEVYDAYEASLTANKRFTGNQSLADAGFPNLAFRNASVVVDSHCPSGRMYFLNEDYLQFRHHKDEFFRFEGFQKPINQNVRVAKIFWAGALTCSNRRFQGVVTGLPTAY